MRLDHLPAAADLTYCTNIHAGETWDEIRRSLDAHVPAIKRRVSPDAPFGLGLRLSGVATGELARPAVLADFREQLDRLNAYVFTLNAFPFGPFHGTPVKERVYEPDWRTDERLHFTGTAAYILSELLPEAGFGSISTVPGGFKHLAHDSKGTEAMVERLLRAAASLVELERRTGKTIALALEPEPCCVLETVEETTGFFNRELFGTSSVARFRALTGASSGEAEEALRRHLGVCYDVCHGAVEYEDPVTALRLLQKAGIAIPKIQLSAAMRIAEMAQDLVPYVRAFDTGVYLHQVIVRSGGALKRYTDLPQALERFAAGGARGEWRIHCHVPIFFPELGVLSSTQPDLVSTLRRLRSEPFSPHLEVETYTWDVLPDHFKTGSKADDIARELEFVLEELGHERHHDDRPGLARHAAEAGAGF
jgi:sugar phosphate isomerase/epimerase